MAQSLAAGGTFGKTADPQSINAAFNLAYSRAENGTTIARTQTINMLRELMFRTCERFLSGGYDDMELSIQAVRDQRLMVSILAIEQLTGAVAPSPVVINANGSSGAGLGGDAIKTFDKLRDEKKKADTAAAAAKKARDEKFGKDEGDKPRECQVIKDALAADPKATVDADKKKECDKLEKAVTDTEAVAKEATKAFTTVEQAMTTGGVSASTVTDAIANGGLNRASPGATQGVADAVQEIVQLNFNDQTETMLFCLRMMKTGFERAREVEEIEIQEKTAGGRVVSSTVNPYDQLVARCLLYFDNRVSDDITKITAIRARSLELDAEKRRAFEKAWPLMSDNGKVDPAKLKKIFEGFKFQVGEQEAIEELHGLDQKSAATVFDGLEARLIEKLSGSDGRGL